MLRGRERDLYVNDHPIGLQVHLAFPAYRDEIQAAARCLALNEWTASVFHMMRTLELALRDLAQSLNITMRREVDLETWGAIIEAIEQATGRIAQEPRTSEREERLAFYSGAASQFRYFKDAWRNHVFHTRSDKYGSTQAWTVWEHLRSFLLHLASHEEASPGATTRELTST